jgi:hypothetical protein
MAKTIELRDVGPIVQLTIPIPRAGVVEISGDNGSGKSQAQAAVSAMLSGSGTVPVRDGASSAIAEGLGVRMTVGRKTMHAGDLDLHSLEGPDPSILVDPGIKDRAAAHAERIRALCRLAHAELDRAAFHALAGGADEFALIVKPESLDKGDVPSVAAAVKRDFEAAARAAESQASNLQIEAKGIASAADDVQETEAPDERALQAELEGASASLGELRGRQRQAEELRASASRARATLESYGDKGTAEAGKAAEAAYAKAREATVVAQTIQANLVEAVSAARAALAEAEKHAESAKADMRAAQQAEEAARLAVDQAFQDFTRRKQLAQAVKAAEAAADVDPEQIAALEQRTGSARVALQRAEVVRRALDQRARARGKADQAGDALSRALKLREAARGCEQIVTDALAKVCPAGMRVEGGFLVVDTDRGAEPFDELSHGERWKWAIGIAAKAIKPPGLLVCRQEGWEALQPREKLNVNAMAIEAGLVILAARAADGPLSARVLTPEGQGQAA